MAHRQNAPVWGLRPRTLIARLFALRAFESLVCCAVGVVCFIPSEASANQAPKEAPAGSAASGSCFGTVADAHRRPLWATVRVIDSGGSRQARPLTQEEADRLYKISIGHFGGVTRENGVLSAQSSEREPSTSVDDDGRFVLRNLPLGAASLAIDLAGETRRIVACEARADGATDLGQLSVDVGEVIQGSVSTSAGEPLRDVSIQLRNAQARLTPLVKLAVTDERGRFVFIALSGGRYELLGGHPDYGVFSQFVSTDTDPPRIALVPPGAIVGTLVSSGLDSSGPFDIRVSIPSRGRSVVDTSSVEGQIRLTPIQPGSYVVSVNTPSDQTFTTSAFVASGQSTDLGVIRLARGTTLKGTVQTSGGKPIEGAKIAVETDLDKARSDATNRDGRFQIGGLPSGSLRLTVKHPDFVRREVLLDVAPGSDTLETELVLEGGTSLRGRVRQRDGSAVAGARILVNYQFLVPHDDLFSYGATTDTDGEFLIRGLPPGHATIVAEGRNAVLQRDVRRLVPTEIPSDRSVEVDLLLEPIVVSGRVTRQDGTPLRGVGVSLVPFGFDAAEIPPNALSDFEGLYRAYVETAGTTTVAVRSEDDHLLTVSPEQVLIPTSEFVKLDIIVDDGFPLTGAVVRERDRVAVASARIVVMSRSDRKSWHAVADGNGRFGISLPPGVYDVSADAPNLSRASKQVTVKDSATNLTLELGVGHVLAGQVMTQTGQPSVGALISAKAKGGTARYVATTDKGGAYRFEGLADEPFTIFAANAFGDFALEPSVQPDGGENPIVLTRGASLTLSVLHANGRPAVGAAVHIVEVNGIPVGDPNLINADSDGKVAVPIPAGAVLLEVLTPTGKMTVRIATQPFEHIARTISVR